MDKWFFDCLRLYTAVMAQANRMLNEGILSAEEYAEIDTKVADKYGLSSCCLFRENTLLYKGIDGNMSHYEEVTECRNPSQE